MPACHLVLLQASFSSAQGNFFGREPLCYVYTYMQGERKVCFIGDFIFIVTTLLLSEAEGSAAVVVFVAQARRGAWHTCCHASFARPAPLQLAAMLPAIRAMAAAVSFSEKSAGRYIRRLSSSSLYMLPGAARHGLVATSIQRAQQPHGKQAYF